MSDDRPLRVTTGPVRGRITAPPSKSLTQRALVSAALASGRSVVRNPLLSDDSRHLIEALNAVGIEARACEPGGGAASVEIVGQGGAIPAGSARLSVGNAGTTMRFLTAMLALGRGSYEIDGNDRMRQRPIEDLLVALRALGATAESIPKNGCPPVRVGGSGIPGGGVRLAGSKSSQYLSAILMAAPAADAPVEVTIEGDLVSRPYVDLTIDMMARFGVVVEHDPAGSRFVVPGGQRYLARTVTIEGDYSSASYFFAAAAVTGGLVQVAGLSPESAQGDARFVDLLERMGCVVARGADFVSVEGPRELACIDADLGGMPDVAPTLAVVAMFARGVTRIRGVPHLRFKETDRIAAV
ncbi:MAG: 3-phosphoshikimate 1-carboxyvinyltransferase, partial [Acidobacteria bacterium]|nr:3-phosphoshikimate 1-carboxyvinyltransferase [Acidobacteriota bacterium]